eukprot:7238171-Prorocentrum_lima.AAC.1
MAVVPFASMGSSRATTRGVLQQTLERPSGDEPATRISHVKVVKERDYLLKPPVMSTCYINRLHN